MTTKIVYMIENIMCVYIHKTLGAWQLNSRVSVVAQWRSAACAALSRCSATHSEALAVRMKCDETRRDSDLVQKRDKCRLNVHTDTANK